MTESGATHSEQRRKTPLRIFALLASVSLLLGSSETYATGGGGDVSECNAQISALIGASLKAPVSGSRWRVFIARIRLVAPLAVAKIALHARKPDLAVASLNRHVAVVQYLIDRDILQLGSPPDPDLPGMAAAAISCVMGDPVSNQPPVANAGPNAAVLVGQTVMLDGGGSQDPDGDILTFAWTFIDLPVGSLATLDDPTSQTPNFMVDKPGTYRVQLVVNDSALDSTPDTADITTDNSPPVANAGPDQAAFVNDTVILDATSSTDVDGDFLIYEWSLTDVPPGSTAVLSDTTALMPTFIIDLPGTYVAELIVNDGEFDSAPDTVEINTLNSAPVADAGMDQTVLVGDIVQLSGSSSFDVDFDPLTYRWILTDIPVGSAAVLSNEFIANPTLMVDQPGMYTASLIVSDGLLDSDADIVLITTENSAPVADAGNDIAVAVGDTVALDGSGSSDADNDTFSYQWSLLTVAPGSAATLSGANTVSPTFVADVEGLYVAQLIVNDGTIDSAPDTVAVFAGDLEISIADASTVEGDVSTDAVTVDFLLTLSAPPIKPVMVNYRTQNVTAIPNSDYVHVANGSISFAIGETSKTVSIEVIEDLIVEADETFSVILFDPQDTLIGDGQALGTILNDEDNVTVDINDASVVEGDPGDTVTVDFLLTLSAAATKPVTVSYFTQNATASPNGDYVHVSSVPISFAIGETRKTVSIEVIEDLIVEDDETFFLKLSSPQNTLIGDDTALGTILNDDT